MGDMMNNKQKKLLLAVIAVVVAMLLFPPFHFINMAGVKLNKGYAFLFSPPTLSSGIRCSVDVGMLLTQWLVVLIVGGIAFFLLKNSYDERRSTKSTAGDSDEQLKNQNKLRGQDYSLPREAHKVESPPVSSPQQSTVAALPIEKLKDEGLYEAILGEKNCIYYLVKFEQFDQQGPGLKASWNWSAFIGGATWALYRKMYGWFFAVWGICIILPGIFEKEGFSVLAFFLLLGPWVAFTIFANSLYHGSVKKKIAVAQRSIRDKSELLEFLRHKGGVHTWVIWGFCLMLVIGILITIAIPQFTAYKQRGSELPKTNAQSEIDSWNAELGVKAPEESGYARHLTILGKIFSRKTDSPVFDPDTPAPAPAGNLFDQFDTIENKATAPVPAPAPGSELERANAKLSRPVSELDAANAELRALKPPPAEPLVESNPWQKAPDKSVYAHFSSLSDKDFKAFVDRHNLTGFGYTESKGKIQRMMAYSEGDADYLIDLIIKFKKENIKSQQPKQGWKPKKGEVKIPPTDVSVSRSQEKQPPPPMDVNISTNPVKQSQPSMENAKPSVDADQRYRGMKGIVLMNGNVIEGQIISVNASIVKIRTTEGNVMSYSFEREVRRFIKE
jgi:hypothetical protein